MFRSSTDNTNARIYGTPSSNSYSGNFTVTMRLYDAYGKENFYTVAVELKYNNPPSYVSFTL